MGRERAEIMSGLSYDAVNILGFGGLAAEPLPQAVDGEIVLRYGGWSLQELRDSAVGQKLMHPQGWYESFVWSSEKLPSGIYHLRVRVPESNRMTFAEQEQMLPEGEQIAPVALVASALLAHRMQAAGALLKNDWKRCREQTADGYCVALYWNVGRLNVRSVWDGNRVDYVWSSSVRTS